MIFKFIKYTQPGWMFNIHPEKDVTYPSCYYHPDLLPLSDLKLYSDQAFETASARYADIGYRAWNKGHLTSIDKAKQQKIEKLPPPTLKDEYSFVFKYWGKPWGTYALLRRLFAFNNPFKEIRAYIKATSVKKINPFNDPLQRDDFTEFVSPLLQEQPRVAVIIPTLNRYEYLRDVLEDLEDQDYENFEVIIVDQSKPFDASFYESFNLKLNVIHQKERLLWTARNNAIKSTQAEYLLFFDDDSRVEDDWISQHLKCIDYFKCDISAGVSLAKVGTQVSQSYNYFRWADQFDSGNALVKRKVFEEIGLFDEQFNKQRMGDGEFGIRAYLNGYRSISNPYAKRLHLKVRGGGLREMGSWDGFRPKKWFAPKPIPSVVYLYKKYYPKHLYNSVFFLGILLSNVGYRYKGNHKMSVLSVCLAVIKSPALMLQFRRARTIADEMLKKNNGISFLQKHDVSQ